MIEIKNRWNDRVINQVEASAAYNEAFARQVDAVKAEKGK